jgi:glycosyltransferase involved in cell wall biosynthesis
LVTSSEPDARRAVAACSGAKAFVGDVACCAELERVAERLSGTENSALGLADAFYSLRSMLLPLYHLLRQEVPAADVYHAACTGYGGLLGLLAKILTGKPYVLTEHGIYPREREEELVQAEWVCHEMRHYWINLFYNLSKVEYIFADKVTSLFQDAMERQIKIGCAREKCSIIPNGIDPAPYVSMPAKSGDGQIDIGAFVRLAPIKDIKTLLYAFSELTKKNPEARLHIMGDVDDQEYCDECIALIDRLGIDNRVLLEGFVNPLEYLPLMDFTVISSISEGQPLAILESLAAGRACVATNVGNCDALLAHPQDDCGPAGLCCAPMNPSAMAECMIRLCNDRNLCRQMGENGRRRVIAFHTQDNMVESYVSAYQEVMASWQA